MVKSNLVTLLLTGFLIVSTLVSCKKDNDEPKSRPALLTERPWTLASVGVDINNDNKADLPFPLDDCNNDDTFTFRNDGTGTVDQGANKCDPDDPQSEEFDWSLNNDETVMSVSSSTLFLNGELTIITLNNNTMEVYTDAADPERPSQTYRVVVKLTR